MDSSQNSKVEKKYFFVIFNQYFPSFRICSGSKLHPLLKTMSLDEFSMTTSLHGWHFIVDAKNWKHKLGWSLLIGLSIIVAVGSVSIITEDFVRSGVDITIDSPSASLEEVSFPSVTICNINQVSIIFQPKHFTSFILCNNRLENHYFLILIWI